MIKNLIAALLLLWCQGAYGEAFSQKPDISFEDIRNAVTDGSYEILMIRLSEGQTLTIDEYALLYYGSSFSEVYYNDMPPTVEMSVMDMTRNEDYDGAWQLCQSYLEDFPFSMYALNLAVFLTDARQDNATADRYFALSENILKVIEASGDGSEEHPFQIVLTGDITYYMEYQVGVAGIDSYELQDGSISVEYITYGGETGRINFAQDLCRKRMGSQNTIEVVEIPHD